MEDIVAGGYVHNDARCALKFRVAGEGTDPLALGKPAAHAGEYGNVRCQQESLNDDRLRREGIRSAL